MSLFSKILSSSKPTALHLIGAVLLVEEGLALDFGRFPRGTEPTVIKLFEQRTIAPECAANNTSFIVTFPMIISPPVSCNLINTL